MNNSFLTNLFTNSGQDQFVRVKDEYIRAPYPAWSAIGVNELITDGTLAEIRVICRRTSKT